MKSIGIKLADGSFYPILEEGSIETKDLEVTTVKDNQTKVQIDLYRSETNSMEDAEYVDSLEITHLKPHPNGEPSLNLELNLDSDNKLHAQIKDPETGKSNQTQVNLISRTAEERSEPANFALNDSEGGIMPGLAATSSILGSPNDEEFSFDPATDLSDIPDSIDDLDEDTTIDLDSLDIDSIEEAQVSDDFMTDTQIIDDDMVSDKPLTDEDMLSPDDLFVDDSDNKQEDMFVDNDGTGFSFVEDEPGKTVSEPESTTAAEPAMDNDFQIPTSLLDSSLFDETRQESDQTYDSTDTAEIDSDIEPPDFADLELDNLDDTTTVPEPVTIDAEPEITEPKLEIDSDFDEPEAALKNDFAEPEPPAETDFAEPEVPAESDFNEPDTLTETEQESTEEINPFALPDFDDLPTDAEDKKENIEPPDDEPEPEIESDASSTSDFDFSLPSFDELDTSNAEDFDDSTLGDLNLPAETENEEIAQEPEAPDVSSDLDLPNFDDDGFANTDETTEESAANETADSDVTVSETSDDSDFSVDDLNLPDFGDVDLTSTAVPETEEKPNDDFSLDLPDFGDDGTADTDSVMMDSSSDDDFGLPPLVDSETLKSSEPETESTNDTSFAIDDLNLPDFDNLDQTGGNLTTPSDLPDFDDPFTSLSNPTGGTEFEFPDFDDSPAKMDQESSYQDSETKDIFGDFDDTDAVFEGDTKGFVDPTAGKKKSKKIKKAAKSYSPEEEDKNSKKPIFILLAALLACFVVILILILQSRTPKTKKSPGKQIASTQTVESTKNTEIQETTKNNAEAVTSMGSPRSTSEAKSATDSAENSNEPAEETALTISVETEAPVEEKKTPETKPASEEDVEVRRPKVMETAKKVDPQVQVVIPAKEDTIIVASNPETVVPVEKKPSASSVSDIKYTVVWGDTLWDISTAYYKTPYRYTRIAEYNGISDANKIKSGQVLLIPAE